MEKTRRMEDEMSRFEAEISCNAQFANQSFTIPGFGTIPPPPMPPSGLIPHQVRRTKPAAFFSASGASMVTVSQPAVVSAKPALYGGASNNKPAPIIQPAQIPVQTTVIPATPTPQQPGGSVDFMALHNEVQKKLKKLKGEKVSAEQAISQGKASSALQSFDDYRRRGKNKKLMRTAAGQTWEDTSLSDWQDDDFRIFAGDLGNDVTDELLTRTFGKYPSFLKARVIRDKRTSKSKGYGFISFKDPADFTRAMKEMNGRYVGSRPIKLRKSSWKTRSIDVARKKEKEKAALLNMLTAGNR